MNWTASGRARDVLTVALACLTCSSGGPAAFADVVPTGDVQSFGGGQGFDGPLPPVTGDLLLPGTAVIFIGDQSSLLVDAGSTLTAGAVIGDFGVGDLTVTGAGTRVALSGPFDRLRVDGLGTFTIQGGAVVDATDLSLCSGPCGNVLIGGLEGADGTLQVLDPGSLLNAIGNFIIGQSVGVEGTPSSDAAGTVLIRNGGAIVSETTTISAGVPDDPGGLIRSLGMVTVDGIDSRWITTDAAVGGGPNGDGILDITGGGLFDVANNLALGTDAGSTASVTVSGAGSRLMVANDLAMFGSARIVVDNGGTLSTGFGIDPDGSGQTFLVGSRPGDSASVLVDSGTLSVAPGQAGGSSQLIAGFGSDGDLEFRNGAQVLIGGSLSATPFDRLALGLADGTSPGTGSAVVDGAGTIVRIASNSLALLQLGSANLNGVVSAAGAGTMDITGGGVVIVDGKLGGASVTLARGGNSQGTLNLTGAGSRLDVVGNLAQIVIGNDFTDAIGDGDGLLSVTDNATVNVTGTDPALTALLVGSGTGNGVLNVDSGGVVNVVGFFGVSVPTATNSSQTGIATISGTGVVNAIDTFVGVGGILTGDGTLNTDTLTIGPGGVFDMTNLSGIDSLVVDGLGSTFTPSGGGLNLGNAGGQDLSLLNGGSVTVGANLDMGANGAASLSVLSGSTLAVGGAGGSDLSVGLGTQTSTLVVDGASVAVNPLAGVTGARISVGNGGVGDAVIRNGASVVVGDPQVNSPDDDGVFVGRSAPGRAGNGTLLVDGPGTSLDVTAAGIAFINVGVANTPFTGPEAGIGTFDVRNGANVSVDGAEGGFLTIARGGNSRGTVSISGTGTTLDITGGLAVLAVGNDFTDAIGDGDGFMTIDDGAVVNVAGASPDATFALVGFGTGNGSLTVDTGGVLNVDGLFGISVPSTQNATQTGFVTIDDTGVVNAINTIVGPNGTLTGSGTLNTDTLTLLPGSVFSMTSIAGVNDFLIDGGTFVAPPGPFTLGNVEGQSFTVQNEGSATIGGSLFAGSAGTSATIDLLTGGSLRVGGVDGASAVLGIQGGDGLMRVDGGTFQLVGGVPGEPLLFQLADGGTASLIVSNGGLFQVGDPDIPAGAGGAGLVIGLADGTQAALGSVVVDGPGSMLRVDDVANTAFIDVGLNVTGNTLPTPTGTLDVINGAAVRLDGGTGFSTLSIARGANSFGAVSVSGPGSTLDLGGQSNTTIAIANNLGVTGGGTGFMQVSDGGIVNVAPVTAGSGFLLVGLAGDGTLVVDTGATINIDGVLDIGSADPTASGLVTIDDTGVINAITTIVRANGVLDGTGTLVTDTLAVLNGGILDLDSIVARVVAVSGSGVTFIEDSDVFLGNGLFDDVRLADGASADILGNLTIGTGASLRLSGGSAVSADDLLLNGLFKFDDATSASFAAVTVNNGGRLEGTGTFAAESVLFGPGGVLAPGESPGALTITGDVVLDGGLFQFELGGTNPGEFDQLIVDGNLDLVSGVVDIMPIDGFTPIEGDTFDILKARAMTQDPGVNFVFNGLGPDFQFGIANVFDPIFNDQIAVGTIAFLAIDIAEIPGLTGNQVTMAATLDDLCPRVESLEDPTAGEQDLDLICGNLRNVGNPEGAIIDGLDALTPDEITGTIATLLQFTTVQHGNLSQRLNGLRSGASRIDVSGLNLAFDGVAIAGPALQNALETLIGGNAGSEDFAKWGAFANADISFGDKDGTVDSPGFDFETINLTLGVDYRLRENFVLGGALGYNEVNADFDTGGGLLVKSMTATFMGTYFHEDTFYVDVLATYGLNESDTSRHVVYTDVGGPVNRRANGDADGYQAVVGASTGYDFTFGGWVVGPHAGTNYVEVEVEGYRETGALGADLILPDQNAKSWTANLGGHVSYVLTPDWGVLVPYARLDYVHEFEDDAETIDVSFANDRFRNDPTNPTVPVRVRTDAPDADYVVWSVGVHAQFIRGIAGFINYRGTAGLDELSIADVTWGLRFERTF